MTKVAILSDTHNLLRDEALEQIADADIILHAGDVSKSEILEKLETIAPVIAVRGNNDKDWEKPLPKTRTVRIEGLVFLLVHDKKDVPDTLEGIDVIVYGHSHRYYNEQRDGKIWLNPGSCGARRFGNEASFVLADVDGNDMTIQKVVIEPGKKK